MVTRIRPSDIYLDLDLVDKLPDLAKIPLKPLDADANSLPKDDSNDLSKY